ncbi:MAG: hypothetical protein PHF86_02715 [Candidatus Nanoarchaeia archaeon]|jgi:hypothetical protein|nr:hypothetical protein [Candidatus Nanoarchaeia archaeon]
MGWDHNISCKECKETVCIARNKKLYRDDESLDRLEAFLNKHADHELIFAADDDYPRVDDCDQFEIEYELESCPKCLQMTNHLNGVCLKCRRRKL